MQYRSFMFTKAFAQMLAGTAPGNPAVIAGPVTWPARLIGHHVVVAKATFATAQLLLGLGIAWRPTVRVALGASIIWAVTVWRLGESLGLVLTGNASPANGAPGAVIICALPAVLLWPAGRDRPSPFVAGCAVGTRAARAPWLVLWATLAFLALQPAARAPQGMSGLISPMASGQPGWLAWIDDRAASALSHQGLAASAVLAAALIVVALGGLPAAGRPCHARPCRRRGRGHLARRGAGRRPHRPGTDANSGPCSPSSHWPTGLQGRWHRRRLSRSIPR